MGSRATQTDLVTERCFAECIAILRSSAEFKDLSYRLRRSCSGETTLTVTRDGAAGLLGGPFDPLYVTLTSSCLCYFNILFKPVQVIDLKIQPSHDLDSTLLQRVLWKLSGRAGFGLCPGFKKGDFPEGFPFTAHGLEVLQHPFTRVQAVTCPVLLQLREPSSGSESQPLGLQLCPSCVRALKTICCCLKSEDNDEDLPPSALIKLLSSRFKQSSSPSGFTKSEAVDETSESWKDVKDAVLVKTTAEVRPDRLLAISRVVPVGLRKQEGITLPSVKSDDIKTLNSSVRHSQVSAHEFVSEAEMKPTVAVPDSHDFFTTGRTGIPLSEREFPEPSPPQLETFPSSFSSFSTAKLTSCTNSDLKQCKQTPGNSPRSPPVVPCHEESSKAALSPEMSPDVSSSVWTPAAGWSPVSSPRPLMIDEEADPEELATAVDEPALKRPCYRCSVCEEAFPSETTLQDHFAKRHPPVNKACSITAIPTSTTASPTPRDSPDHPEERSRGQCPACADPFSRNYKLEKGFNEARSCKCCGRKSGHLQRSGNLRSTACKGCGKKFTKKRKMRFAFHGREHGLCNVCTTCSRQHNDDKTHEKHLDGHRGKRGPQAVSERKRTTVHDIISKARKCLGEKRLRMSVSPTCDSTGLSSSEAKMVTSANFKHEPISTSCSLQVSSSSYHPSSTDQVEKRREQLNGKCGKTTVTTDSVSQDRQGMKSTASQFVSDSQQANKMCTLPGPIRLYPNDSESDSSMKNIKTFSEETNKYYVNISRRGLEINEHDLQESPVSTQVTSLNQNASSRLSGTPSPSSLASALRSADTGRRQQTGFPHRPDSAPCKAKQTAVDGSETNSEHKPRPQAETGSPFPNECAGEILSQHKAQTGAALNSASKIEILSQDKLQLHPILNSTDTKVENLSHDKVRQEPALNSTNAKTNKVPSSSSSEGESYAQLQTNAEQKPAQESDLVAREQKLKEREIELKQYETAIRRQTMIFYKLLNGQLTRQTDVNQGRSQGETLSPQQLLAMYSAVMSKTRDKNRKATQLRPIAPKATVARTEKVSPPSSTRTVPEFPERKKAGAVVVSPSEGATAEVPSLPGSTKSFGQISFTGQNPVPSTSRNTEDLSATGKTPSAKLRPPPAAPLCSTAAVNSESQYPSTPTSLSSTAQTQTVPSSSGEPGQRIRLKKFHLPPEVNSNPSRNILQEIMKLTSKMPASAKEFLPSTKPQRSSDAPTKPHPCKPAVAGPAKGTRHTSAGEDSRPFKFNESDDTLGSTEQKSCNVWAASRQLSRLSGGMVQEKLRTPLFRVPASEMKRLMALSTHLHAAPPESLPSTQNTSFHDVPSTTLSLPDHHRMSVPSPQANAFSPFPSSYSRPSSKTESTSPHVSPSTSPVFRPPSPSPVFRPHSSSPVDRPPLSSPVFRPPPFNPLFRPPPSSSPVVRPHSSSPVFRPPQASPVFRPPSTSPVFRTHSVSPVCRPIPSLISPFGLHPPSPWPLPSSADSAVGPADNQNEKDSPMDLTVKGKQRKTPPPLRSTNNQLVYDFAVQRSTVRLPEHHRVSQSEWFRTSGKQHLGHKSSDARINHIPIAHSQNFDSSLSRSLETQNFESGAQHADGDPDDRLKRRMASQHFLPSAADETVLFTAKDPFSWPMTSPRFPQTRMACSSPGKMSSARSESPTGNHYSALMFPPKHDVCSPHGDASLQKQHAVSRNGCLLPHDTHYFPAYRTASASATSTSSSKHGSRSPVSVEQTETVLSPVQLYTSGMASSASRRIAHQRRLSGPMSTYDGAVSSFVNGIPADTVAYPAHAVMPKSSHSLSSSECEVPFPPRAVSYLHSAVTYPDTSPDVKKPLSSRSIVGDQPGSTLRYRLHPHMYP